MPAAQPILRIIPLGGVGEIGKNMYVFEYGDEIVIIDCGLMFPDEEMFGIDLVVPDVTYLKERREQVKAFLITRSEELTSELQSPVHLVCRLLLEKKKKDANRKNV